MKCRIQLFPLFTLFILYTLFVCDKTKLAGQAIFPDKEYKEWQTVQLNPDLNAEEKVKSTVNTFFIIEYESWVKGTLFDFSFLFNQTNPKAYEDYAYERGLMYYKLEAWKLRDNLLERYEYLPEFYEFKVEGQKAILIMRPNASIFHQTAPNMSVNSPWTDYKFSLVFLNDNWLIESIECNDEHREDLPHGTDFEKLAATIPERQKKFDAKVQEEYLERMQNDPKYMEILERRRLAKLL